MHANFFQEAGVKITYDKEPDALYIRFPETTVTTRHPADGLAAGFDADGNLAGVELLDAGRKPGSEALRQVTPENIAISQT